MDLDSFRGRAILYGAAGKKVLTDFAGADDVIKIGLTKTTRSAADRVNDYVRNGCVNAGVVHFLFDDDSYGVLIPFHAKAFETVVLGIIVISMLPVAFEVATQFYHSRKSGK